MKNHKMESLQTAIQYYLPLIECVKHVSLSPNTIGFSHATDFSEDSKPNAHSSESAQFKQDSFGGLSFGWLLHPVALHLMHVPFLCSSTSSHKSRALVESLRQPRKIFLSEIKPCHLIFEVKWFEPPTWSHIRKALIMNGCNAAWFRC